MSENYLALLRNYMWHVRIHAGTDFIGPDAHDDTAPFTKQEWDLLVEVSETLPK